MKGFLPYVPLDPARKSEVLFFCARCSLFLLLAALAGKG
jgi:hypothetical protein